MRHQHVNRNVICALLAAVLFGASTPFAKLLIGNQSPVLVAGLLYLGSGVGLALTGAYFSIAPFIGAALAVLVFGEATGMAFWLAASLMGLGVWLHLTETHVHVHVHPPAEHGHEHSHDAHHQHDHDFVWRGLGSHKHPHQHRLTRHSHPHFPDTEHQHDH